MSSWRVTEDQKKTVPHLAHMLGGGLGGIIGALVTSPLEVVKTRLQAKHNTQSLKSNSMFGTRTVKAIVNLVKTDGFLALYRGLATHITGVVPARSIHFLVYGNLRNYLESSGHFKKGSDLITVIASASAGTCVITLTQPIWFAKTRLQLQATQAAETMYSGSIDVVRKTLQREGFLYLYRGMGASYLGLSETVIQFFIYENLKRKILEEKVLNSAVDEGSLSVLEFLSISSGSKLVASALTYPHEVIRTRLREVSSNKYKGPFHGIALMAKEEGIRSLYSGLGPHLCRVIPNAALLFMTYELTLSFSYKYFSNQ
eukprot:TRINITY_DN2306_c0_g1_i1.p1 TRINITY_DN2306_c0_g1~~TRINITY_DN2306_c0_g1_i1.p1  ORF type:complete len:315 (-),score=45.99 TRINITY_DN2306_c0_g1_i1:59-1003(-)